MSCKCLGARVTSHGKPSRVASPSGFGSRGAAMRVARGGRRAGGLATTDFPDGTDWGGGKRKLTADGAMGWLQAPPLAQDFD